MSASGPSGPLVVTSAAYIQVHFKLDFFMEANNMNPDQIVHLRAV